MTRPTFTNAATADCERQVAELAALQRMLTVARGCFSLSISICNSPALRDYLIAEATKSFANLRSVMVPRGIVDVYGHVVAESPESPSDGLFILNLENSVQSGNNSQSALRSLNASRELWEQRFRCPVVFWLPEYATTLLARHAPDFWRYRSHRFEFVSELAGAQEGLADRFAGDLSAAAALSSEEKRFRIAELEQRISEAGDPPRPELAPYVIIWITELGFLYQYLGDLDGAEKMLRQALEINEKLGRLEGMAVDYGNLGLIYRSRGDLDGAEKMLRQSMEIEKKLGHIEGMAADYGNLGLIYQDRGDLDGAEKMLRQSLEINEKLGRLEGMANNYGNLGLIYRSRGDLDGAEKMHRQALEIDEKLGRLEGMANAYVNLSVIYRSRGDLDGAEKMLRQSLEINEKLGRLEGMANAYGNLGLIYKSRGDFSRARELWEKARELYQRIGMPHIVERVDNWLAELPPG